MTENTLILLQLLVNGSHMTTQRILGRQIVALLASKTNSLVNRPIVLSKTGTRSEQQIALQTTMHCI
jgi:hypothetical protein